MTKHWNLTPGSVVSQVDIYMPGSSLPLVYITIPLFSSITRQIVITLFACMCAHHVSLSLRKPASGSGALSLRKLTNEDLWPQLWAATQPFLTAQVTAPLLPEICLALAKTCSHEKASDRLFLCLYVCLLQPCASHVSKPFCCSKKDFRDRSCVPQAQI